MTAGMDFFDICLNYRFTNHADAHAICAHFTMTSITVIDDVDNFDVVSSRASHLTPLNVISYHSSSSFFLT